jgi:undecaprenyl-diphosphatase
VVGEPVFARPVKNKYKFMHLDHILFKSINALAGRWLLLDSLAIFCAEYLIFGLVLFLLYFYFLKKINWKKLLFPFTAVILVLLINKLISLLRFRARPFITHPEVYRLVDHSADKSFPSDHTAIAFALGTTLWFFNKKWGSWFLVAAFLIGLARIFCGLHYPVDILVGGGIGCGLAVGVNYIFQKKKLWF